MTGSQTRLMRQLATVALVLLGGNPFAQCTPSPPSIHSSSSRGPPALPQYYATSSHRPPSVPPPYPTSSLAPTSPVYTAQRIRSSDYSDNSYNDPYPSAATSNLDQGKSQDYEEAPENSGFVEPIDFSGLLKDVGSSPKGPNLDIQSSHTNPLFASESKDTFQGFFGSSKNPFEELSRLHTASSDHNSRQQGDEINVGFVDPNVQFRSLFDSAGGTSSSTGFGPGDFLGSKSENVGSAPSKGSQTRAYPSFTYSGRGNERDREETEDYPSRDGGSNRYRSSYRQVNGGDNRNNDYYPSNNPQHNNPDHYQTNRGGQYDDYDGISNNSPQTDSYDDYDNRGAGPSYVANSGPGRRGVSNERSTPRYSSHAAQETSQSPSQSKPRAAESKNPKCKKVEKSVDYGDDHASFTEPDSDYDPSTYQGRYKRQARQRQRQGGSSKRPMTCYVCEDEHGRYAEKCSYDSKGNPNNDGNYYHSESSSFSDNGRSRPSRGGGRSKDRHRRNSSTNRQRYSAGSEDPSASESTTRKVYISVEKAEIAESEPTKVIGKRQSGDFYGPGGDGGRGGGGGGTHRNNQNRDEYGDPYDGSTGSYAHPSGYEGPPLGARESSGGRDEYGGGRGGRGGSRGGGAFDSDFNFGPIPDFEREAASATREYDFSIPREFDPDYQLRPTNNGNNNNQRERQSNPQERGPPRRGNRDEFEYSQNPSYQPYEANNAPGSTPHQSASNRQDDFDVGYNDYIRQNFPEAFNSPSFTQPSFSPSYSPRDYDFKPNYYHRPGSRQENNQEGGRGHNTRGNSPEVSNSPSHDSHRGYDNGYGRGNGHDRGNSHGRGNYAPIKEHTQPSHNFSPPPGFFSEDAPAEAEGLGNILKEFSTRSRDGCRKVNKGDMTCYVCRDAKGGNKEECMYASNDPKNKAMAYHEVTEYSSPQGRILPAPLHASLLGHPEQIAADDDFSASNGDGEGTASSPLAFTPTDAVGTNLELSSSQIDSKTITPTPFRIEASDKSTSSPSSTEASRKGSMESSTTKSPKRSKRSPTQGTKRPPKEYDFDYDY